MESLQNYFIDYLQVSISYLIDPNKRVYWLYLFTSLILALWVFKKLNLKGSFFKYVFDPKIWLGRSARVDFAFLFFNGIVKVLFIAPLLIYALTLSEKLSNYLTSALGSSNNAWSPFAIALAYTITIVVVNDFFSYIIHWAMHKNTFLWRFHKTHHSATELNPFTQYRIHPVELIINNIRGIVVKGLMTGIFLYISNGSVNLLTFLGINIFNFLFLFFGANLRHSHIPLKYFGFLEYILISPYQHQIHHSNNKTHFDSNLGSRLAIWDYLFGSLIRSEEVQKIEFGLCPEEDPKSASFFQNLLNPFKK